MNGTLPKEKKKAQVHPLAVAMTGAVVGAGIAVALNKKKNREAIKGALKIAKNRAIDYVEKRPEVKQLHKKITQGKENIEKTSKAAAGKRP